MCLSGLHTATQRARYGRYPAALSADELARYFHLDDDDRDRITNKRRDSSRFGFTLQLTTARFLGTSLEDPTTVPVAVLHAVAAQLDVAARPASPRTMRASSAGGTPLRYASATATANS